MYVAETAFLLDGREKEFQLRYQRLQSIDTSIARPIVHVEESILGYEYQNTNTTLSITKCQRTKSRVSIPIQRLQGMDTSIGGQNAKEPRVGYRYQYNDYKVWIPQLVASPSA
ncbi:hypothetical protein QE152_g5501 [Popillia japonica]|uniref:Uncharacterized protein n=1 Tax=Popillia japonica TaxID=7064 RepID=A0AAW1MHK4_POPJA